MRCDYAACTLSAVRREDGWGFCADHYLEHRADLHGEKWPRLPLVPSDRHAVWGQIAQLDALGLSSAEIAVRLRVTQRMVHRHRARTAA